MNNLEKDFIEVYGVSTFNKINQYIQDNDIYEYYMLAKKNNTLFKFGFHYGILEIVSYCYCVLKIPIIIDEFIDDYYKTIDTSVESESNLEAPLINNMSANSGLTIAAWDKFTEKRNICAKYLIDMKKFSKYNIIRSKRKCKFEYKIVDKYIKQYDLLKSN